MRTGLLPQLPSLGFALSALFCASQETVQKELGAFEYTGPEQDGLIVEEAYYLDNVGIHVTYQDGLVAELMIRGRHCGHDIGAHELRSWARLGEVAEKKGPMNSTWRIVDVDGREVFAQGSLLPGWLPNIDTLLAKKEDEVAQALGPSFCPHDWLGYANAKSRVDLHLRFSRADGRLTQLAINLPLGIDVPSRKCEILEWAGILAGSTEIEVAGLVYEICMVPHGIELRASVPWTSPLPEPRTIHVGRGRDKEVTLVEAVALAEAELAVRYVAPGSLAVVDPERFVETETFFVFCSVLASQRDQQNWLPQTYDPEVGVRLDDPGTTFGTQSMPNVRVDKATGRCHWGSFTDRAKHQIERVRDRVGSAFRRT